MILFTCKKYHFLIEKNLPSLPASRLNDLLPTGPLITLHPKIRKLRHRDLSEFRQIYLRVQVFVGLVMTKNTLYRIRVAL